MENQVHRVGPAYAFLGNPNVAAGAGMKFLGYTRGDVTVAPNLNISTGRVDQIGTSGLAESAWSGGLDPVVTLPLIDEDKQKLSEIVKAGKLETANGQTSFGFGSGFEKLYTTAKPLGTLALIPFDELDEGTNGIDAPNGVWLPAAVAFDFGNLVYNLPEGTDDAHVVHEVQMRGLRLQYDIRASRNDQDKDADNLIPRAHRIIFIGSPRSVATLANWSLPPTAEV